ncbi:MAG: SRPBCC family protein [Elsteraceae bacterium]
MELTGETLIPAPRQRVWEALNDPEILRQSITGCESIEKLSDTELTAKVTAKVGPVKATFTGAVTLSDIDPPNGYRISGEGKGGVAGFAKGGANVTLTEAEGGTLLSYSVDAQVGGKLAQIGSRLIDATAKSYAKDFFEKFSALVGQAEADAAAPKPAAEASEEAPKTAAAAASVHVPPKALAPRAGLPPAVWITGVVALVVLLLALGLSR